MRPEFTARYRMHPANWPVVLWASADWLAGIPVQALYRGRHIAGPAVAI